MSEFTGKKWFTIHSNNAGTEAYSNKYVQYLEDRLADAEADNARLRESLKAERDAVRRLNMRSAIAEASARWLLYDAPGRPYIEVEAFVRERQWLKERRL